jgi:hypothetical protein
LRQFNVRHDADAGNNDIGGYNFRAATNGVYSAIAQQRIH